MKIVVSTDGPELRVLLGKVRAVGERLWEAEQRYEEVRREWKQINKEFAALQERSNMSQEEATV